MIPSSELRPGPDPKSVDEALASLRDGRWAVRLRAVHWLVGHGAGRRGCEREAVLQAIVPLTRDPKRRVRQLAIYAVGRRRDGVSFIDAVPLLVERVLQDPSPKVRRMALGVLAFHHAHPDLAGFFEALLADVRDDPKLHRLAGIGLVLSRESAR